MQSKGQLATSRLRKKIRSKGKITQKPKHNAKARRDINKIIEDVRNNMGYATKKDSPRQAAHDSVMWGYHDDFRRLEQELASLSDEETDGEGTGGAAVAVSPNIL